LNAAIRIREISVYAAEYARPKNVPRLRKACRKNRTRTREVWSVSQVSNINSQIKIHVLGKAELSEQ